MPVPWWRRPPEQLKERICIVEDDEWVADSLKVLLETFGYEVESYNSAAEFLADDRHRATCCLIIDHHMPEIDGLDVIGRLQKGAARVLTILISGRLDTKTRERAASLGVTNIVEKPFAAGALVELIRTALSERN
jgi:FixJ family two-component response regulator